MVETLSTPDFLKEVKSIEPILRKYSEESEELRHLPQPVVDAMINAGLFRIFKPKSYGGYEIDPITGFRVIEEVSRIDSAAGWNLQLAAAIDTILQWFSDAAMDTVYANTDEVIVAGTWNPPCKAVPVDGGYHINGIGNIASGCMNANWFFRNAIVMEGDSPRIFENGKPYMIFFLFPESEGEVIDAWDTLGMRGTGSHDIQVTDLFVPELMTAPMVPIDKAQSEAYQGALYRNSNWHAIAILALPALGIARAAIDDFLNMTRNKIPRYTEKTLKDREVVQRQVAEAEASLGAGRAYLYEVIRESWQAAQNPEYRIDMPMRMKIQLATTYAIQSATKAVDIIHEVVGLSGIRRGQSFQKHFRDIHCITQHAFSSTSRYEDVGKLMFGLPVEWPFFEF